jgi:hypothetical protein
MIRYRTEAVLMIRLILTLAVLASSPSLALAQEPPSPDMLKSFPEEVYRAAVKAHQTALKANEHYAKDLKAYEKAKADLRRAIKEEEDFSKYAEAHSNYILRSVLVSGNAAHVIHANSEVVGAYIPYVLERNRGRDRTFDLWQEKAWAHVSQFDPAAGEDPELSKQALAKHKELYEKSKKK